MTALGGWRSWLTVVAIAGSGLAGGVFLAYSTFTMSALRRLPPDRGLQAMQAINRAAERSGVLMVCLFGTAVACVALGIGAVRDTGSRASVLHLVAGGLYLAGVVGMTVAFHVPRNNALAHLDPTAPDAFVRWTDHARVWTAGNHVRTVTALAATILYAISLRPA